MIARLNWVLGLASLFLAVLIGLQQYMSIGQFIQLRDALHHEFFMAFFGALGIGVLIGTLLNKKNNVEDPTGK